ncbi:MAG: glycoside hydrolase family 43 protein [Lachnospiraceae bacterium]|nr:glycoside hydrolase family 43 protein [Lachnospiraceae bacterium]
MGKIHNPILRGFHPDPSIIRVGEDYYIATSTFEWWPGVRLHHSRDLVHWELIGYPLDRVSQLDLRGVGPSQGIWAPCLTYDKGIFYLVYTVVKSFYCNMYDTENYLVTAEDIRGPWSEPAPLNNFGFDPSLFHDEDGRKYMVSMVTDHRVPKKYAGRLVLQEFDPVQRKMMGPVRDIYRAEGIFLEGPHIFRREGWYYLFSADTGTGEGHGQTIQRSRNVWGPYEMYRPVDQKRQEGEAYSILTSRHHEDIALQKAGHCDLVETPDGEWYAVHLCGRPSEDRNPGDAERFPGARRYMLGRETAIQRMRWTKEGWLELAEGGNEPREWVEPPRCAWRDGKEEGQEDSKSVEEGLPKEEALIRDDFEGSCLHLEYQSLRIPMDERYISLSARPGWLRMYGRSGLASRFSQTLIARRMTEYYMDAETCVDFEPEVFKQMAGLILMYDTENYLYLHISHDEDVGKCITLLKAENKKYEYLMDYTPLEPGRDVVLGLKVRGTRAQFYYGYRDGGMNGDDGRTGSVQAGKAQAGKVQAGPELCKAGPEVNAGFLSDEACREGWFTGTMAGLCCQDLTGFGKHADFDWFEVCARV